MTEQPQTMLTDGRPVTPDHKEIQPDGMQKAYVVLTPEERSKGFVRPVRRSYIHVGIAGPTYPLRALTADEVERFARFHYVKYEAYPESESPQLGRFWTQAELNSIGKGCGAVTTMGDALAETYAREPGFYGGTFCAHCRAHYPVGEAGQFVWDGTSERVGT